MNATTNLPEPSPGDDPAQRLPSRFRFARVNEITGTFVLVIVVVLIAAVVWTGHSQRWFKSRIRLRIALPETGAAGIRQGSEVYFLGTLVGSVSDVTADKTGRMEAEASIRRDFFRFVRVDASAVIKKKFGVAGDSFFEITRGAGQPLPEHNALIVCKEEFQSALEVAVEQVRGEAMVMLKKVNGGLDAWSKLGADLGETQQHLNEVAVRLEKMATDVGAGKGTVGKLLADTVLVDEAQTLLARANEAMSELQGVVTNLNIAATRLPEITGAVAGEAKDLPGLVLQTQSSMREVERLIAAMQHHWLLRKYVNQTNPPPLGPLPEVGEPAGKPFKPLSSPKGSR